MKTIPPLPTRSRRSRRGLHLAFAALALVLAGCDIAHSRQPVGRKPASLAELHLEGTWRDADGRALFIRVADPANARLEVASVETNADGFVLNRAEVFVREENDVLLASVRGLAPHPEENYTFGRLAVTEGALAFHSTPASAIRRLALDGTIGAIVTTNGTSGNEAKYEVVVTNGFERLGTVLASPAGAQYLDLSHPTILQRQKAGLD